MLSMSDVNKPLLMGRVTDRIGEFMPSEPPVYDYTDINFQKWAEEGVRTHFSDVEACLGETGNEELVQEYVDHLKGAREFGIDRLALVTNLDITTKKDRGLLSAWQEQTDADIVLTPLHPRERKPSPVMLYKGLQYFGYDVNPNNQEARAVIRREASMVDDKASAGIRAANFVGLEHRAWTRPFGENRHIGDKLIRDPLEANLRIYAHLLLNPIVRQDSITIGGEPVKLADVIELRPDMADGKDKIVGYGLPDIELSPEVLDSIKRPAFWVALEKIQETAAKYGETPEQAIKEFLYEHGRTTADALTNSRVLIAAGLFAIHHMDIDPETKQKLAKALVAVGYASDAVDGFAAKNHKDGVTKKGGAKDQNYDKLLSAATDLWVLLPSGTINRLDAYATIGRDIGVTLLRGPFKARGIDTKSVKSGKISTNVMAASQLFSMFLGERYPVVNSRLRHVATGLKIATAAHAPFVWIEQHELKLHNARNLAQVSFIDEMVS